MTPVFNIIDAVLAVFKCVTAIPDAIMSLDPGKILECVPDLVDKINNLLNMIPQLSIPRMVISLVKLLAQMLGGFASDLRFLQRRLLRMARSIDRAADLNDPTLSAYIVCAQANYDAQMLTTAEALAGVGRIILLINIFMGLFGGPEIPCFGQLLQDARFLEPVIDIMELIADLLNKIAFSIPDPQIAITKALGGQVC
jgi:hypothetical protein